MSQPSNTAREPITIVTACDENYVRAAAAAIVSAVASVGTHQDLQLFVLDGGVSQASKQKFERSCGGQRRRVNWLSPDLHSIRDMPVARHINLSTYLRILLAEMLPSNVSRAIYLDADIIVVRNLLDLWKTELDGAYCGAVQEVFCPVLEPAEVYDHPLHCMTMPGMDPHPIPNYRELGLSGSAAYFNAGIMLVNVDRWRDERVAARAFQCLRQNAGKVRFWDQYALNVLFSGQWKMLDARWNQNAFIFKLANARLSHYNEAELSELKRDPWIVHFNYLPKPWDIDCAHPFRKLFFQHLDRTSWHGWRPRRTLREHYRKWRQTRLSPVVRAVKNWLLGCNRNAA